MAVDAATVTTAQPSEERRTRALAAGGVGSWQWDRARDEVRWDPALEAMHGLAPGAFGGSLDDWTSLLHAEDRGEVLATVTASRRGAGHQVEHRICRPDGQLRWLHCRGEPIADDNGDIVGSHGVEVDVTQRRVTEAGRERLLSAEQSARDRLEFLAQAGALLSSSLDVNAAMGALAELCVPRLGDCCVVDVLENQALRPVALAHRIRDHGDRIRGWRARHQLNPATAPFSVVRNGTPELRPDLDDALLRRLARDQHHLDFLRSLGLRSAVIVPLVARGTVLGTITLLHDAGSQRRHTRDDLALAEELGSRAGIALDNAQQFEQRAAVADVLHQALRPPELPAVPGVDLATRHQPAAAMAIGGDFYDVVDNDDGSWTVLFGDVCGKDASAAALAGLARHSTRAAVTHDAEPRSVLSVMNHALRQHSLTEQFCTAVCARLRPRKGGAHLEMAIAGHPPPLVRRADGVIEPVEAHGQLLGLFDDPETAVTSVDLGPADTMVLYTDGITEARNGRDLFGDGRLAAVLRDQPGSNADGLADAIVQAIADFEDGERRDDLAVLTVQVPAA